MATFRVGVGSFNIQDGAVGFGTDIDGLGNLRVKGVTKTSDIKVSGASTLTRYSGFAADELLINDNTSLLGELSSFGDIVVNVGAALTVGLGTTVTVGTVESVSIGTHFSTPKGGVEERGNDFVEGMMRFNTDLNTMEFYNGNEWRQFTYISDIQNSPSGRGRAIFFGGYMRPDSPYSSGRNGLTVEFIQISTGGESVKFGSYGSRRTNTSGCSNGTRALSASGYNGPGTLGSSNEIEYITIASEGNPIDFGDRTQSGYGGQAVSSSTRGVFLSNREPNNDVIDYVEIGTLGNALDFGDLIANGGYKAGNLNSPTRGFVAGGSGPVGTNSDDIQMVTIASKGNAIKVGDLTAITDNSTGASNSVRGLISFGEKGSGSAAELAVSFITLASEGNAQEFGDLTVQRGRCGGAASQTRAIFAGGNGYGSPSYNFFKSIDSMTIATAGNAIDFGSLGNPKDQFGATSDSHGGLGGY
jgi:hypothetical protein